MGPLAEHRTAAAAIRRTEPATPTSGSTETYAYLNRGQTGSPDAGTAGRRAARPST